MGRFRRDVFFVISSILLFASDRALASAPYTIDEFLSLTAKHSPKLAESRAHEEATKSSIGVAESGFLPSLSFEAIDSSGFAGSSAETGVGGIMSSPFRSGYAYGAVLTQTIWDFGRTTNQVRAAESAADSAAASTGVSLYQVQLDAVRTFYHCSLDRSEMDAWNSMLEESKLVANEVNRFVKTGQRSVVEKYLADSQMEQAATLAASFAKRYEIALRRLSILSGIDEQKPCPVLPLNTAVSLPSAPTTLDPLILQKQADLSASQAHLDRTKAENYPTLVALASAGEMQDYRLVSKQNYSLAVGVVFPLFEGLRTTNEIHRARAEVDQKERALDSAKQDLDEVSTQYEQEISATQTQFEHLMKEFELAQKGFEVAKKRYFALQGSLLDLQEALRNLERTRTQLDSVGAEYRIAAYSKALLLNIR
jgi:outer membrane protein